MREGRRGEGDIRRRIVVWHYLNLEMDIVFASKLGSYTATLLESYQQQRSLT